MKRLKAAVIGLGNIGFLFNLDSRRKETWSHVSAYEKCPKTELAGVVEIDADKRRIFKRHYSAIPVFNTIEDLLSSVPADIVSICTPTPTHHSLLKRVAAFPVKAVFCEKPIAEDIKNGKEMIELCRRKRIILCVNHVRRWEGSYRCVRDIVFKGKIGNVSTVNALYSGGVFNIGTHLFDTVRMIIGKDAEIASGILTGADGADPDVSGWIKFGPDTACLVSATGKRADLVFEIDAIGSEGRVRIVENGVSIQLCLFKKSRRYSGYRELVPGRFRLPRKRDRFIAAVDDVVSVIDGRKKEVDCSGEDALAALGISSGLLESARRKNIMEINY